MIQWLSIQQAHDIAHSLDRTTGFDVSIFHCDTEQFRQLAPVEPEFNPPEPGLLESTLRWYLQIGSRLLSIDCIDCETDVFHQVMIWTPPIKPGLPGWTIVEELKELPTSISLKQPYYIHNSPETVKFVVYCLDGIKKPFPVYKSPTQTEAEEFLAYLKDGEWADRYFIDRP